MLLSSVRPENALDPCGLSFICDNDLVIVIEVTRFKKVKLNRAFSLFFVLFHSENESIAIVPGFGFPLGHKIRPLLVDFMPAFPFFDHGFQLSEAFKRHRGGKLDMVAV